MIDVLTMDGDDSADLVRGIEQAFGVTIDAAEAADCETVGDLFDIICVQVPTVGRSESLLCPTASAFRALRRAILAHRPDLDVYSASSVADFAGDRDHRRWHAHLTTKTRLTITAPTVASLPWATAGAMVAITLFVSTSLGHLGIGLLAAGVEGTLAVRAIARYAPRTWRASLSLGELASETAARSVGLFVEAHGAIRRRDLWKALVLLMRPYAGLPGEIGGGTRLFAERA